MKGGIPTNPHTLRIRSIDYVCPGEVINTYRPQLDGDKVHCPRCHHKIFRESVDIYCLACGWRESFYFDKREMKTSELNIFIENNIRLMEQKEEAAARHHRYYEEHKAELATYSHRYYKRHKKEIADYQRWYYKEHKASLVY